LIRELDVRFPPSAVTSEEDREAQVLLLASDLGHVKFEWLTKAAMEWVRTKAFMPKASELINLSQEIRERETGELGAKADSPENLRRLCDLYNARPNRNCGAIWVVRGTNIALATPKEIEDEKNRETAASN